MLQHGFCLVEEPPVFEGGDEIADGFAFDADGGGEDVVADCEHAGDDDHAAAVKEGGEGGAEFSDVDDDAGRFGGGCQTATASNAGVDCAEKLFLRVCRRGAIKGEGEGHILEDASRML